MNSEDKSVDATFGQSRAFSLESSLVNPNVVIYLRSVRQEALRTNAISNAGRSNRKRHKADLYDDENPTKVIPSPLISFNESVGRWIDWFEQAKQKVTEEGHAVQEYDETSLNLLLYYLKDYIATRADKKGVVGHISKILQELEPVEENEQLEIDPSWAENMLKRLRARKIRRLEDLKNFIRGIDEFVPMGFKEWYRFCQEHEPAHVYFTKTINSRNIWVLIQYMSHDWIKDIHKQKKIGQVRRFSAWLLYTLFHLPTNVTAEYISNLRELGKKCQRLIVADAMAKDIEKGVAVQDLLTSEMVDLSVPIPPKELDILKLALAVITVSYGQRDLTNWQEQL